MSCIKPDRECPPVDKPSMGDVNVSGKHFGSRAVYTCPHGYHVVGLQSRLCQADGTWAGSEPICKQNSKWISDFVNEFQVSCSYYIKYKHNVPILIYLIDFQSTVSNLL